MENPASSEEVEKFITRTGVLAKDLTETLLRFRMHRKATDIEVAAGIFRFLENLAETVPAVAATVNNMQPFKKLKTAEKVTTP